MPVPRLSVWLFVVLLVPLVLPGCGGSGDGEASERRGRGGAASSMPTVEAVEARYGALPLRAELSGTVEAINQVIISPEISAAIVEVRVENGDYVEAGTPLVRLRDDVYREQLRQAEAERRIAQADAKSARASLKELQAQLGRTESLAERQFQSEQELESIRARVMAAEAQVEQADARVERAQATVDERQADLSRTVIRAPIDGYVGNRNAQVGQRVDGATQLFTMGSLDTVRVRIAVSDRLFGQIRAGQSVRLGAPAMGDTTVTAEVSRISPFLNNESYSAEAEVDVPNPGEVLVPGMFVQASVAYGESEQATIIPTSALYEDPNTGAQGVFVAPTLGTEVPVERPEAYDPENLPPLTQPTPTTFRTVDVLAKGQQTVGVRGIEPGAWVITVGQDLLQARDAERVDARVRPMPWSRLLALQKLQDRDVLRRLMKRQQRIAKQTFGAGSTESPNRADAPPDTVQSDVGTPPQADADTSSASVSLTSLPQ
jgi:RND family efflux transporter MFP subunit